MGQRSGAASGSDLRSLKAGVGKGPLRPAQLAARNIAVLVLLGSLLYTAPQILGPGFFPDKVRGLIGFASVVGNWARAALAVGFQSIPTL